MEFDIATADDLEITDQELTELLTQVYVAGGSTTHYEALTLFEPTAVRGRGVIIAAREEHDSTLAGRIIIGEKWTEGFNPNQ